MPLGEELQNLWNYPLHKARKVIYPRQGLNPRPPAGKLSDISTEIPGPTILTGYNQSVTGCGSQQSYVVVIQRKLM